MLRDTRGALCALALAITVATPALAVDGVIEINQVRALAGGVTGGDTPGFPITIDEPGSYRLTSDIEADGEAIRIAANNVTLDLNGFAVLGNATCSGSDGNVSCSANGAGRGIICTTGGCANLTVSNGTVRGHLDGIVLGNFAKVEGVRVFENVFRGIQLQQDALVRECVVSLSGNIGIETGNRALIVDSKIINNDDFGIGTGNSSLIQRNQIVDNGTAGISGSVLMGYGDNYFEGNGAVVSGDVGVQMGTNACGNVVCP